VFKIWAKYSQPFGENVRKLLGGGFFDSHCIQRRDPVVTNKMVHKACTAMCCSTSLSPTAKHGQADVGLYLVTPIIITVFPAVSIQCGLCRPRNAIILRFYPFM